jgi:hypothetical protein
MMLAMRLLSAARGGSEEQDGRTVDSVLAAAAKRLGEPATPAVSRQLEANGVKWAWQMTHFSEADWDQLGVPLGLKCSAKAELAEPSTSSPSESDAHQFKTQEQLTDRMRRFLLLPDAEGTEAKPLGEMTGLFIALLAAPVAERQTLLLALCELVALVSGLILSSPFDLRSSTSPAWDETAAANQTNIWLVAPTREEGRDAVLAFIFLLDSHVAVFAVALALYVAASGSNADDRFCEGAMNVLGLLFATFFMGVFFPLITLCFWQFFTDAVSPYPMLANILVVMIFHQSIGGRLQRFFGEAIALEVYHTPDWFLRMLRSASRGMGTYHLLAPEALKAAAEKRAAKLRAQMLLLDTISDDGAGGSPANVGAAIENRARRGSCDSLRRARNMAGWLANNSTPYKCD